MSDTPRTDAAESGVFDNATMIDPEFARTLERELNTAEEYIKRLLSAGNHIADISTDRRRLLWLDAVNSRKAKQ